MCIYISLSNIVLLSIHLYYPSLFLFLSLSLSLSLSSKAFTMDSIMSIFYNDESDTLSGVENTYASAYDDVHRSLINYLFAHLPTMSLLKLMPWPFGSMFTSYIDSVSETVLQSVTKEGSAMRRTYDPTSPSKFNPQWNFSRRLFP